MPNSATEGLLEQQSCQTRLQIPHGEPRVDRELSLSRGIEGRDIFAKVFPCCLKLWNPIAGHITEFRVDHEHEREIMLDNTHEVCKV